VNAEAVAGFNFYSDTAGGFGKKTFDVLPVYTAHAAAALDAVTAREKAMNLERALITSREIGMAIGILMTSMKLRDHQAFDLLRLASQATHRKLVEIARDVVETGTLDLSLPRPPDAPQDRSGL